MSSVERQHKGIDYDGPFSPVVKFTSICLVPAIVVNLDLELHQVDVKIAFFNRSKLRKSI